ncbi:MAG: choice-of-anchor tandem repeat GloVer-containing protein [Terriglobales bacterium]
MKRYECLTIRSMAIIAILVFGGNALAAGSTEKVLYNFSGGADGSAPSASLVADSAGNLYGTTASGGNGACQGGCGTVFELSPNPDGSWTETQLYSFNGDSDGVGPQTSVIFDGAGNLYGATQYGGTSGDGTVFRLTPSQPGSAWTKTVLYNFDGHRDGEYCFGGLVFDTAGNLYGATLFGGRPGGGTVFQLVPPTQGNNWSLKVLHAFKGVKDGIDPWGGLVLDTQGAIYGTTYSGTIFRLKPPPPGRKNWSLKTLYHAGGVIGVGALLPGAAGVLYGTSSLGGPANQGTVFQLAPPRWTAAILYNFAGGSDGGYPVNGLTADNSGILYGITKNGGDFGAGTMFKLSPPAKQGGAWTKTTLHSFGTGGDGSDPGAGVILGAQGVLYGTTVAGGLSDNGSVFEITP